MSFICQRRFRQVLLNSEGPLESSAVVVPTTTVVLVDAERHLLTELRPFELALRPSLPGPDWSDALDYRSPVLSSSRAVEDLHPRLPVERRESVLFQKFTNLVVRGIAFDIAQP